MKFTETGFDDLLIIEPKVIEDERGYFMESYVQSAFTKQGVNINFIQDNQSKSKRGVIRGLHFQNAPHAQTKLIRCLRGTILDVAVDLRKEKHTFGKTYGIELSSENKKQLLIPKGFAHGFAVLSEEAEILYKCDEMYYPQLEGGIAYNDPVLKVDWRIPISERILSTRDQKHPVLEKAIFTF